MVVPIRCSPEAGTSPAAEDPESAASMAAAARTLAERGAKIDSFREREDGERCILLCLCLPGKKETEARDEFWFGPDAVAGAGLI
uniref:Uncharacterized protein n=1 Tax=Arundo donax TaxID=35708 RepID=A0A0A9GA08_ARUDO